jgi:hypothetical protein
VSVALVIHHAKHMRRISLSPAASLAPPFSSRLSHKQNDVRKRKLLNTKCVFISTITFLVLRINQRGVITNVHSSPCKVPAYSFLKPEFSRQIFEKFSYIKFHENPSNGSRVVPCGRTDMTKLIVAFCNFADAPKKRRVKIRTGHIKPT